MEGMKSQMVSMLQGIERYNPDNIKTLECYVDLQARERGYDLEANLALLKLYQFNPTHTNMAVVVQVRDQEFMPSSISCSIFRSFSSLLPISLIPTLFSANVFSPKKYRRILRSRPSSTWLTCSRCVSLRCSGSRSIAKES